MPVSVSESQPPERKRQSRSRTPVPRVSRQAAREEGLQGIGQAGALACVMAGQYADAGAFALHWPAVAREVAALAEENDKAAQIVDYLCNAGPYAGVITAVLPFALQILVNHDRIPADKAVGIGGVMRPAELEKKVREDLEDVTKS